MRFRIMLATIVIGVLGLVIIKASSNQTPDNGSTKASAISSEIDFHDFGEISMKDGNVQYTTTITNTDSDPIVITKLHTSCMCTKVTLTVGEQKLGPYGMEGHGGTVPRIDYTLAPGQTGQVEVEFDPNAHGPSGVGLIERSVFLDMSGGARKELKFKAMVRP